MEIRTYTDIAAPPERVWAVLADFAGYERWNPVFRRMTGRCEPGAAIRFVVAGGPAAVPITAEIVVVEPGRELRWVGPAQRWLRRVALGSHWFRLEPTEHGTRLEHGETFRGAAIPARWPRFERWLGGQYARVNDALRREAEAATGAAPGARGVTA